MEHSKRAEDASWNTSPRSPIRARAEGISQSVIDEWTASQERAVYEFLERALAGWGCSGRVSAFRAENR